MFKPFDLLSDILKLNYETMSYKERVQKRWDYIQEQLAINPDYVGWDYPEYWGSTNANGKENNNFHNRSELCIINTYGELATGLYGTDKIVIRTGFLALNYKRHSVKGIDGKSFDIAVHRALACTFIPIPEKYATYSPSDLVCNHINGNKQKNILTNIEWLTQSENLKIAVENGTMKGHDKTDGNVIGKWMIPGVDFGRQFYLSGKNEILATGLDSCSIYQCARGEVNVVYGCEWKWVQSDQIEEIEKGIPEHLLDKMLNDPAYVNLLIKVVKATVVKEGPFYGTVFCVYGAKLLNELGFQQAHVSRVCSGKLKTHAGCKWEQISREEAETIQRNPSEELLKFLFPNRQ